MRADNFPLESLHEERRVAGEAADATWRAWRYPLANRTASSRGRAVRANLHAAPVEDREARAEAAWNEVMQRLALDEA